MKSPPQPTLRHRERDVRRQLARDPVDTYAAQRIVASYDNIAHITASCPGIRWASAFDIGCSAGLESFALSAFFDDVLAIDNDFRLIHTARQIARRTGASGVTFRRANADLYDPRRRFDFVFCNGMSHASRSRCELMKKLRTLTNSGGWMHYAQVSEGFAPRDLHDAIAQRDARRVTLRLYQVLAGLVGQCGFRFFVAGTLQTQLEALGFDITGRKVETWGSLVTFERLWCKARARPAPLVPQDSDYVEIPPELSELKTHVMTLIGRRRGHHSQTDAPHELSRWARNSRNRLAPLAILVEMAEVALPSLDGSMTLPLRLRYRGPRPLRPAEPDWDRLADLDREFLGLIGLATGEHSATR